MENTKQELSNMLQNWSMQWTDEFIRGSVLPHWDEALNNPMIVYAIKKWQHAHDWDIKEREWAFKSYFEKGEFATYKSRVGYYSEIIYDFFAHVLGDDK